MALELPQLRHRIGVAFGGFRIYFARHRTIPFGDTRNRAAQLNMLADPGPLRPGCGTSEPNVGPEPAAMALRALGEC